MNNCFHANVVIVDSTSFQVDYLFYCIILNQVKKSQAGAVKTLLNTDLIKIFLPPPAKISADASVAADVKLPFDSHNCNKLIK